MLGEDQYYTNDLRNPLPLIIWSFRQASRSSARGGLNQRRANCMNRSTNRHHVRLARRPYHFVILSPAPQHGNRKAAPLDFTIKYAFMAMKLSAICPRSADIGGFAPDPRDNCACVQELINSEPVCSRTATRKAMTDIGPGDQVGCMVSSVYFIYRLHS